MALNFDPTKTVRGVTSTVKIFEQPKALSEKLESNDPKQTPNTANNEHLANTIPTPISDASFDKLMVLESALNGVESVLNLEVIGVESVLKNSGMVLKRGSERCLDTIPSPPFQHQLDTVVGNEREFMFFIAKQCQKNGSLTTVPLTIEKIKTVLNYSKDAIKTVVYRLTQKNLISRTAVKKGRSGWVCYGVNKAIYDQILNQEDFGNGVEMVSERTFKKGLTASSSSRDLNIKESTPELAYDSKIPEQVDVTNVLSFGISKSTIVRAFQLYPNLKVGDLQDLVFRFGVFAKDPKTKIQNSVGFFINLCKQLSEGVVPLDHIHTPDEKLMADLAKQSRAAAAQKQETEDALLTFEFEAWLESVPFEKRNELVPESAVVRAGSHAQTVMLKKYYVDNFWDDRRKELLRQFSNSPMASVDTDL